MLSSKTPTHLFSISTEPRATHKMKENHERCFLWSEGTKWASKHLHLKKKEKKKALSRLEPWAMGSGYVTSHCGRPPSVQRASLSVLIFLSVLGEKKNAFRLQQGCSWDTTWPNLPHFAPETPLCSALLFLVMQRSRNLSNSRLTVTGGSPQ